MTRRHIKLKGAHNFRDIGGYTLDSGKRIKTRMIFRSDRLSKLTTSDLRYFEALNIKLIIDLRDDYERHSDPSRLPQNNTPTTKVLSLHNNRMDIRTLKQQLFAGKLGQFDFHEFLLSEYRHYITQHDNELKKIFTLLLDPGRYPVLIHCNGGKDRTGTVTALIHYALGLRKETIFDDYMLSGDNLKRLVKKTLIQVKLFSLFRANTRQLKPLMETHPEYLQEAINTMERNFGSIDAYLNHLGMHQYGRKQLCDILCHQP